MLINNTIDWIPCSHALNAGGTAVVGLLLYATFAIMLFNWSESIYPPAAWTALTAGLTLAFVPGTIVQHLFSLLTLAVTFGIVTIWHAWRR